jgi:hypothetical protein
MEATVTWKAFLGFDEPMYQKPSSMGFASAIDLIRTSFAQLIKDFGNLQLTLEQAGFWLLL